jgi:hypothetical protein
MGDYRLKLVADRCQVSERTARRWRDAKDWRWVREMEKIEKEGSRPAPVPVETADPDPLTPEEVTGPLKPRKEGWELLLDCDSWTIRGEDLPNMSRLDISCCAEDASVLLNRLAFLLAQENDAFKNVTEMTINWGENFSDPEVAEILKARDILKKVAEKTHPDPNYWPAFREAIKNWA